MPRDTVSARLRSFRYAFAGLRTLFATQVNFRLHAIAAALVVVTGVALHVSPTDWLWLTAAVVGVLVTESLNTALEFLADAVSPEHHPLIGRAKDCAAAAVLVAAFGALVVGSIVLGPPLLATWR